MFVCNAANEIVSVRFFFVCGAEAGALGRRPSPSTTPKGGCCCVLAAGDLRLPPRVALGGGVSWLVLGGPLVERRFGPLPRLRSVHPWGVALRLASVCVFRGNLFRHLRRFGAGQWPAHFRQVVCSRRNIQFFPWSAGANFDITRTRVLSKISDLFASRLELPLERK